VTHGYAKDSIHATEIAINAGSDMDMESSVYIKFLSELVINGKVKETTIDEAVKRVLKVKFELGLFDNPYKYCDETHEKLTLEKKEFKEGVLDISKKSIVLLKNEASLLPLKKSGLNIALIGALANDKNSPLGNWRLAADDNTAISVFEGMQNYKGNKLTYAKGADVVIGETRFSKEVKVNTTDKSGFEEAITIAKSSDVVIMVLGENGYQSGEGRSRTDIGLPGVQQELLEAVYVVNNNIVLVLNNGRPLAFPWAAENIPAIVEAWQLGTQSGNAIAQVLYGDYNPSGKLPMTFPRTVSQLPIYYNHKSTGRPVPEKDEDVVFWSHYTDEKHTPLYPFGYGLSYSKFEYSNLKLNKTFFNENEEIVVTIDLKNNSEVAGREVVQMYIRDLVGSFARPIKELKGFELVDLKPFETKTVTFVINEKTIEFYSLNSKWEAEEGDFKVFVGGNSEITIEKDFKFNKK
jgi:beta-glucosidase